MIKTVTLVTCNKCQNTVKQFYTLVGTVYCSEDRGNGEVGHCHSIPLEETHLCDSCFSELNPIFDKKKRKKL